MKVKFFYLTLLIPILLSIAPSSALTVKGHVRIVHDVSVFLGYKSGFTRYHLTNENYTVYFSNGKIYEVKPDPNGNFTIELPKGTYKIWVEITLRNRSTSNVADVPHLYLYPTKRRPVIVNLTNDTYLAIEPREVRWYPPEPINVRLQIVGHVYNPEHRNLTIKLYKPIYSLKTTTNGEEFEFKNVLPARNYTIEVIPGRVELGNGTTIVYEKAYVKFKPYTTPKHEVVNVTVDIPFRIEGITPTIPSKTVPGFETVLTLLATMLILRRTSLR